jgi:uncharacterized membrane protein YfcA
MDSTELIVLITGVGFGFFVQTVAGFAGGLFALPIILQVFSMQEAVAFLSILPFFIIALFLGNRIYGKVNESLFRNILFFLLAASGISLIVR